MTLCWYDVEKACRMSGGIASFLRLLSNQARGYLVEEGVPSCATHAIHWFDDFCRKTRRFGVRVPRCPPVNAAQGGREHGPVPRTRTLFVRCGRLTLGTRPLW
jgi:hypothetical protein